MSEKQYLTAQQLLEDSFRLGADIIKDGFRPSIMIAIWRGGVPMGIARQERRTGYDIETDHQRMKELLFCLMIQMLG